MLGKREIFICYKGKVLLGVAALVNKLVPWYAAVRLAFEWRSRNSEITITIHDHLL